VTRLLFALVLTSCGVDVAPRPDCGPLPSHGTYAATYGEGTVTLSRADFDALIAERHALKAWALCVAVETD
jgi:hypothetical protein